MGIEYLQPGDVPALYDLCEEQNQRDGTNYAPPEIFVRREGKWEQSANVPLAAKLVRDGRMLQAYTFERRLEFSSYGIETRATALALRELPAALVVLEKMGYTGFHSAVPQTFVDQWERTLGKRLRMTRDDHRLAHYYRSFKRPSGEPLNRERS
jgi:hypothetical protein